MSLLALMRRRASLPMVIPPPPVPPPPIPDFAPLFAVAGGAGRNGQSAFQYTKLLTTTAIDGTIDQSAFQAELNAKALANRWINYSGFTTKRIIVPDNQPIEPVLLWRSNWGGGFTGTNYPSWATGMDQVCRGGFPVPDNYVPDSGSDKELALLQPTYQPAAWTSLSTPLIGRMFEGWIFEANPAYDSLQPKVWPNYKWRCGWPARACGLNIWPGHFVDWKQNASQSWWPFEGSHGTEPANPDGTWQDVGMGASASGIALADSELLVEDLNRNINGGDWGLGHCIGLSVPTVGGYRWPAMRSDASSPSSYPLKYGMRLCLPADYVIPSTGIHPVCRALIQNCILSDDPNKPAYGFVVHEQTNAAVVIKAQPGAQAYWSGVSPSVALTGFPWDQLLVVQTGSDLTPVPIAGPPTAPTSTTLPLVAGTAASGQTLGAHRGAWAGSLPITYAYQWQNSADGNTWADISGETNTTYLGAAGDVGKVLRMKVTATNTAGSTSAASSPTAAAAAGPAAFTRDSATGSNGTLITARAGEVGATWTPHPFRSATFHDQIQANRFMGPPSLTNTYFASAVPPSADYTVTAFLTEVANNDSSYLAAVGRMDPVDNTMYFTEYLSASNTVRTLAIVGGVVTTFGSLVTVPKFHIAVKMVGDQISGLVDGVVVLGPFTSAHVTAAGRAGIRHGGSNTTGGGVHLDHIEAA